jgi:superfamily I DNA/RNA helicase
VAYLAFTKAAAKAAATKISGDTVTEEKFKDHFPFFRTIHSLCFRGVRERDKDLRVMKASDWKRFSQMTGMRGSFEAQNWEDLTDVYLSIGSSDRTEWDNARTAYTLSRLTASTEEGLDQAREEPSMAALQRIDASQLDPAQYSSFVIALEHFKDSEGLIDFTDMLEYGLRYMTPVNSRYLVVDEGQDLCPLHFAILDRLFEQSDLRVLIGDEDQAIYNWSGADAALFLKHARRGKQVILRQTHRFGQPIVDYSAQIIRRVNERIEKGVIGLEGRDGNVHFASTWDPVDGDYFILHRHVAGCQELAKRFMLAGVPFTNERGMNPLGAGVRLKAFKHLFALSNGQQLTSGQAKIVVEELLPSIRASEAGVKTRYVVHGGKKRVGALGQIKLDLDALVKQKVLTKDGERLIRERDYEKMKHAEYLAYYDRLIRNGHGLKRGGPRITTMHGSKGRQASSVVVFSEIGRRCMDEPDSEHRLAYVGVTRTETDVTIVDEQTLSWTVDQYPYPMNGNGENDDE